MPTGTGQFKHDVFVFGHCRKLCRWQLDDPGTTNTVSRYGETAGCFHDGGKLQLHPRKRKPQHAIVAGERSPWFSSDIASCESAVMPLSRQRHDGDRTRQIGAEHG